MNNVINLSEAREERTPHCAGAARCLACDHEWVGVAPTGTIWLECPSCTLERGRFIAQSQRDGDHWHCACGCDLFYITPEGAYCPNCGSWKE